MTAYQITSMMEGVVQRGTATVVKAVGKPIAGKTGTTNDEKDAWFIGFSPDIAVGVYHGLRQAAPSRPRRDRRPCWRPRSSRDFLKVALADKPAVPFRVPAGIKLIRIDAKTGMRAGPGQTGGVILEAFKLGHRAARQLFGDRLQRRPAAAGDCRAAGAAGLCQWWWRRQAVVASAGSSAVAGLSPDADRAHAAAPAGLYWTATQLEDRRFATARRLRRAATARRCRRAARSRRPYAAARAPADVVLTTGTRKAERERGRSWRLGPRGLSLSAARPSPVPEPHTVLSFAGVLHGARLARAPRQLLRRLGVAWRGFRVGRDRLVERRARSPTACCALLPRRQACRRPR